jgi:hypothetical protein
MCGIVGYVGNKQSRSSFKVFGASSIAAMTRLE